jgi:formyltetrahydrofolate deformylase
LVATIAGLLQGQDLNIVSMREHVDSIQNRFYARVEISKTIDAQILESQLKLVLPPEAQVIVNPNPVKKVVVLVTKEYHCLSDILVRNHFKTLGATVLAVVGNHSNLEDICNRFDMPFTLVSHEGITKETFELNLYNAIRKYDADYLILAKFMRILSPSFVEKYPLRIINIHHSFLPAFIGANPYKQAYERLPCTHIFNLPQF